jgi:hypothetical protein
MESKNESHCCSAIRRSTCARSQQTKKNGSQPTTKNQAGRTSVFLTETTPEEVIDHLNLNHENSDACGPSQRAEEFSELFMAYLLTRNSRIEEDLIDQLFNSSEKRLARLFLLAHFGKDGSPKQSENIRSLQPGIATVCILLSSIRSRCLSGPHLHSGEIVNSSSRLQQR